MIIGNSALRVRAASAHIQRALVKYSTFPGQYLFGRSGKPLTGIGEHLCGQRPTFHILEVPWHSRNSPSLGYDSEFQP